MLLTCVGPTTIHNLKRKGRTPLHPGGVPHFLRRGGKVFGVLAFLTERYPDSSLAFRTQRSFRPALMRSYGNDAR